MSNLAKGTNTFSEKDVCTICEDEKRRQNMLMVVQMPSDIECLEVARCHDGLYFVLMGQAILPEIWIYPPLP